MVMRARAFAPIALLALAACERAPLNYVTASGAASRPVVHLNWGLTAISLAVIAIICVMVIAAIVRRRPPPASPNEIVRAGNGLKFVYTATGISTVILFVCSVWSLVTLAKVSAPPSSPAVVIDVIGHQWWWEARYHGDPAQRSFTTANELHIPVGVPVALHLTGEDVIHSFWVPQLAGKTDTIPGLTNVAWLEADKPGVYYGQCTEYCGHQHAQMGVRVIAESADAFAQWWNRQLQAPAPASASGQAQQGAQAFLANCASCHTIRGTAAGGVLGPDLSHLKQRQRIAGEQIDNTPEELRAWIAHPQAIKPGALMPDPAIDARQLDAIVAYLETLE